MATLYDPTNALAPTPPMGWNSYNPFGGEHGLPADTNPLLPGGVALEERLVLETADALVASGLRDAGYVYLNLDDRWQDPVTPRDAAGRLQADLRRFPRGMKAVGDEIHARGLKFGIYTVANVWACGGEEGCGPGGFPATGSLGHEDVDAQTFADWGVDFLKIDWCGVDEAGNRGRAAEVFETWNHAIAATGRDIVLSASTWGEEAEETWGPRLTHMWRTTADVHATWESVRQIALATAGPRWAGASGPTRGWNDPDLMHVGHPALTLDESWTHLVLWSMLSAPLLAGNDVRTMPDAVRTMLLDPTVVAVVQDPSAPATVETVGPWDVWTRRLSTGALATAVVNASDAPATVPDELWVDGPQAAGAPSGPAATHVVGGSTGGTADAGGSTDEARTLAAHGVRLTVR